MLIDVVLIYLAEVACGEVTYVNLTFPFQWIFDRELKQKDLIEFIQKNDREFMHRCAKWFAYEVWARIEQRQGENKAKTRRRVNEDWMKI